MMVRAVLYRNGGMRIEEWQLEDRGDPSGHHGMRRNESHESSDGDKTSRR
jgi:hypothetical protein